MGTAQGPWAKVAGYLHEEALAVVGAQLPHLRGKQGYAR